MRRRRDGDMQRDALHRMRADLQRMLRRVRRRRGGCLRSVQQPVLADLPDKPSQRHAELCRWHFCELRGRRDCQDAFQLYRLVLQDGLACEHLFAGQRSRLCHERSELRDTVLRWRHAWP